MLRPGEWDGLAIGTPDLLYDLPPLRYALFGLLLAVAWLYGRGHRRAAAGAAVVFAAGAVSFWIAALGRPYGVFVDAAATRRAADVSVLAESGRGDEGFLVGEPPSPAASLWTVPGLRREARLLLPTWLPLIVLPATAAALSRLGRPHCAAAAILWLAFATGDLDTVRGAGFVPGLWAHPESALLVTLLLCALALVQRWIATSAAAAVAAVALVAAGLGLRLPAADPPVAPAAALLLLTLDQGLWLVLGGVGLRTAGSAIRSLTAAGAALVMIGGFGAGDIWAGHALYRAGLLLAALGPLAAVAAALGAAVRRWGLFPDRDATVAGGAVLILAAAGSTLAWWDPPRWDPVARGSVEPLSRGVQEPMDWFRTQTPPDAVVLASPEYAPWVAVIGGRRVLRAPTLQTAPDDDRRRRLERLLLMGDAEPSPALRTRYGVSYVLAAPGDFDEHGIRAPHELERRPHLRLRHVSAGGFRIFEVRSR